MSRPLPAWVKAKGFSNWQDYMASIRKKRGRSKRLTTRGSRNLTTRKKNPRIRSGQQFPATDIELRYRRTSGQYAGELFKHKFGSKVELIGLPDGSIQIRSFKGKRLYGPV